MRNPNAPTLSYREMAAMATTIRQDIIAMLLRAGSGHSAGSLGMADVFTALYFGVLSYDPKAPDWQDRDRLLLSNGHICPVWYATLAHAGFFPVEELIGLRSFGSGLQGHPHRGSVPGVENTAGPLGLGLSQAIGVALSLRMDKNRAQVYCLMSDGEHDEGNVWEAAMFASKYRLGNLTAIIDRNNIQIDGFTEDVMPLEPFADKYRAFGWHVLEIDGHNYEQIAYACQYAKTIFEKPVVIIAHTIPGKGADFMEFDYKWHGVAPNPEQAKEALKELRTLQGRIQSEHE